MEIRYNIVSHTYVWSLFFVLVLCRLGAAIRFPRNCAFDCSYKADSRRLLCEGRGISCVPTPCCLQATRTLDLANNNIALLSPNSFYKFPNLRSLDLHENNIKHVSPGAFLGLMSMTSLDLSGNKLNRLKAATFSGMPNLRHLNLEENTIYKVDVGAFVGLPMLMYINMNDNELRSMHPGMFEPLRNLLELHLDNNQITSMFDGALYGLKRLKVISLADNELRTLPNLIGAIPNVRYVAMEGNPLVCDCHLEYLRLWFVIAQRLDPSLSSPTCERPFRLQGQELSTIIFPLVCWRNDPDQSEESVVSKPTQATVDLPVPGSGSAGVGWIPAAADPPPHGGIFGGIDLPSHGGNGRPTVSGTSPNHGGPTINTSGRPNSGSPTFTYDIDRTTLPRSTANPRVTESRPYSPTESASSANRGTSKTTETPISPSKPSGTNQGLVLSFDGMPPVLHPDYDIAFDAAVPGVMVPANSAPIDDRPTGGTGKNTPVVSPTKVDPTTEEHSNGHPSKENPGDPSYEFPASGKPTEEYPPNKENPTEGGRPSVGRPTIGNGNPSNGNPTSGNGRPFDGNPSPDQGSPFDGSPSGGRPTTGNGVPHNGNPTHGNGNPIDGSPTYGNDRPNIGGRGPSLDGNPDIWNPTNPTEGHHNNGNPFDGFPNADPHNGNPNVPPTQGTSGNGYPNNADPSFGGHPGNGFPRPPNGQPPHDSPFPELPTPAVPPAGTPPEAWGLKGSKMCLDCGQEARQAARSGSRVKWLTPSGGVVNHQGRGRFVVAANGSLVVSKLQGADTGAYRCIIRNDTTTRISMVRLQVACPCGMTAKSGINNQYPDVGFGTTIDPPPTPETRGRRSCNITPVVVAIVTTFQATVALCSIVFCAWYSRCGNREQWKSRVKAAEQHSNVNTVDKTKEASLPNSWRSHSYEAVCSTLGSNSSRSTDSISSSSVDNLNEYVNSNVMKHYSEDYVDLDPHSRTIDETYSSLTRQSRRAAAAAVAARNKHRSISETVTG